MKNDWYSTRHVKAAWNYFIGFIDDLFHSCDVVYGDKEGYDLSKHKIYIKKRQRFARLELMAGIIKMLLLNLVPGTRVVKYKDEEYLFLPCKGLYNMAGRMASKVFDSIREDGDWAKHVERMFTPKVKKEKVPVISKENLEYLYYDRRLSIVQISELVDKSRFYVNDLMRKYDMPRRHKSASIYISQEKLAELYYEDDFTLDEMGKIFGVDRKTVMKRMEEYNMPRRDKVYTAPAISNMVKAFKSVLRKKFRINPYYIEVAREIVEEAEKDPDLYKDGKKY